LPCYVRFKVKELINIDVSDLTATVSGTLLVSIYYGNLSMDIVKPFSKGNKPIMIQFSRQESILLKEDKGIMFNNYYVAGSKQDNESMETDCPQS